jgi:hypothetical protein
MPYVKFSGKDVDLDDQQWWSNKTCFSQSVFWLAQLCKHDGIRRNNLDLKKQKIRIPPANGKRSNRRQCRASFKFKLSSNLSIGVHIPHISKIIHNYRYSSWKDRKDCFELPGLMGKPPLLRGKSKKKLPGAWRCLNGKRLTRSRLTF